MARYATLLSLLLFVLAASPVAAQEAGQATTANYQLAARFAPYKIQQLLYSTSVSPRWIEGSERFWYEWETSDGTFFYLVDPVQGAKRQLFDNDRIAAELTRITRDPWDGQHLPIRAIKFVDENTLQFEVESSQDKEEEQDEEQEQEQDGVREQDQKDGGSPEAPVEGGEQEEPASGEGDEEGAGGSSKPDEMTEAEAERMLDGLEEQELENLREDAQRVRSRQSRKVEKDW